MYARRFHTLGLRRQRLADFLRKCAGGNLLSIAGLGTATFNDANGYAAFAFPPIPDEEILLPAFIIAQFDNPEKDSVTHILGLSSPSLAGYNLASAFGPLTAPGLGIAPVPYSTTAGTLLLTSGGNPVTPLLAIGGLGALAARRRRRTRQNS
jgi:MYXO-CTERM domain-containing protein